MVVCVQARTWPGINKHGGVARIAKVHEDSNMYDVVYILGGKEKQVEAEYISTVDDTENGDKNEPTPTRRTKAMKDRMRQRAAKKGKEIPVCVLQALAAAGFNTLDGQRQSEEENTSDAPASPKKNNNQKKKKPAAATKKAAKHKIAAATKKKRKATAADKKESNSSAAAKKKLKATDEKESNNNSKKRRNATGSAETSPSKRPKQQQEPFHSALPMNRDEKCALADKHYHSRFQAAITNGVIYALSSSLRESDRENLSKLVKEVKKHDVILRVSETFNAKRTTLVLMPSTAKDTQHHPIARSRTLKVMRASLVGLPIVTPKWITSCLEQKALAIPTEDMYVRSLPTKTAELEKETEYGTALLAARHYQRAKDTSFGGIAPLHGTFVCLCGEFITPPLADVQLLLREAGATMLGWDAILKKKKNDDKAILLFNSNEDAAEFSLTSEEKRKQADDANILAVSTNWLFDSISCGEPLPESKIPWIANNNAESQAF